MINFDTMKLILLYLPILILFSSCNGCSSNLNEIDSESFENKEDYATVHRIIKENEIVKFEGELIPNGEKNFSINVKSILDELIPSISSLVTDPVNRKTVDIALHNSRIGGVEEGSFLSLNKIDGIIDYYLLNKTLKDTLTHATNPTRYTDKNLFGFYSRYGTIKSSMLSPGNDYRRKLVRNLINNYNNQYLKLLSIDRNGDPGSRSEDEMLRDEFLGKTILLHQITYNKDTIPHYKYYSENDLNRQPIPTIFDVSAVCPPICPQ